jgi:hypothetical protein
LKIECPILPDTAQKLFVQQIQLELQALANDAVTEAQANFETKVREYIGTVVMKLANRYSVQFNGAEFIIKVDTTGLNRG